MHLRRPSLLVSTLASQPSAQDLFPVARSVVKSIVWFRGTRVKRKNILNSKDIQSLSDFGCLLSIYFFAILRGARLGLDGVSSAGGAGDSSSGAATGSCITGAGSGLGREAGSVTGTGVTGMGVPLRRAK